MKRAGKSLDVKGIDALKPHAATYRVSDGGELLLEVRPSGAKVWLCRLTVGRKRRRDMGLGGYPAVSLKAARAAAQVAREKAAGGTDPVLDRKRRARAVVAERDAAAEAEARTFAAVAEKCIAA